MDTLHMSCRRSRAGLEIIGYRRDLTHEMSAHACTAARRAVARSRCTRPLRASFRRDHVCVASSCKCCVRSTWSIRAERCAVYCAERRGWLCDGRCHRLAIAEPGWPDAVGQGLSPARCGHRRAWADVDEG